MKKIKRKNYKLAKKKYLLVRSLSENDKLRRVLDENPDEEIENEAEEIVSRTRTQSSGRGFYLAVGVILLALSIIGLVSTVRFSMAKINDIVNNTAQKNEFADIIYPLVLCDPAPFDGSDMLHPETKVMSACWKIILDGDTDRYAKEFDYMTVPAADVAKAAAMLYGDNVKVTDTTIKSSDFSFFYSAEKDSYRIPVSPRYFSYSPRIDSISKTSDGFYVLEVGYISPTPAWFASESDIDVAPDKYMTYTLQKSAEGYIVTSVRLSDRMADSGSGL